MPEDKTQPTLQTQRLVLRPFELFDAADVQRLAGDRAIAETTLRVPHPYEDGMAEEWISSHPEQFERGELVTFAVTLRETGELIGAIGLTFAPEHRRGELGYWMGKQYWGNGYCTEAARAVVAYGFDALELNRITGSHLTKNPASGRVIQKIGMTHEGHRPQHVRKWDHFEDLEIYGLLRSDYHP